MKKEIDIYDLIEHYIKEQLSPGEMARVKELIASSEEYKKVYKEQLKVHDFIVESSLLDIKNTISEIHREHINYVSTKFRWNKLILIGAGIAIVIAILIISIRSASSLENTARPTIDFLEMIPDSAVIEKQIKEITPKELIQDSVKLKTTNEPEEQNTVRKDIIQKSIVANHIEEPSINIEEFVAPVEEPISLPVEEKNITEQIINRHQDVVDVCDTVVIIADVVLEESCNTKPTGSIEVVKTSVKGGTPPYFISVDNGNNYYNNFLFENLSAATYHLSIKDGNNCKQSLPVKTIFTKDCTYQFAFAPDRGERWLMPTQEQAGAIVIRNKSNVVVFEQVFDMPGEFYWNGNNMNGESLPMGIYFFVLQLDEEEPVIGNVTITR